MADGKTAHTIFQKHLSGKEAHPLLKDLDLPSVPLVEEVEKDERLKVEMPISDDYSFHGYMDGRNDEDGFGLELKFGSAWSVGKFNKLPQWKLYSMASGLKTFYLINAPLNPETWNRHNVLVFRGELTERHKEDAKKFLEKGIDIIENIEKQELYKKSYWCNAIGCEFCANDTSEIVGGGE